MKTQLLKEQGFQCVSMLAGMYQKEIDDFKRLHLLERCWLSVDSNGDAWVSTVKPEFSKQPNLGVWLLPANRKKVRRAIRLCRLNMLAPAASEYAITEIVK